jgi:thioredoxin reductase
VATHARSHSAVGQRRRGDSHDRTRTPVVDALVVGGGPAGLSTALVLGRARRSVLVLDTGKPANAVSNGVGGLLGHERVLPADLRRSGREQLARHPNVEVRDGAVLDVASRRDGFQVKLEGRTAVRTRALVLAHGLRYDPPALPGVEGLWGRTVFHCPFCDGWEVRDRPLAVHGNGPAAARSALVISTWSDDVLLCTDGPADLGASEREALARAGVRVREERVRELAGRAGWLDRIEFETGPAEPRDAMFVRTVRDQPNGLAAALGCELTEAGTIAVDADGRTGVPGVFAAGDAATEHSRSVANAIGSGSRAAYAVALDLV